jgi:diguanylate cyclase (GGDEF)-like protein/PAS domain S-box-containing protein
MFTKFDIGEGANLPEIRCDARIRQLSIEQNLAVTILSCTQEGIVITDPRGNIITVNAAFSRITGYALDEVVGKSMRVLQSGLHPKQFYQDMWRCINENDYWQGEIWNRRKSGEIYPALVTISGVRSETGDLTHYVGSSADLSPIKSTQLQLEYRAHHDELTGLPNRRLLSGRLESATASSRTTERGGAVVFIDLDRFKLINDSLGHAAGDEVLIGAAERLRSHIRSTDLVARFGGDEFVLLCDGATRSTIVEIVERILYRLSQPYLLSNGMEVCLGASAGISVFPDDGLVPANLIQYADAALYHAKGAGKGTYRFFSTNLTKAANSRLSADSLLRQALKQEEFELHYQPLISISQQRITGFEALIRWRKADGNLVSPGDFIPVAEDTGLIVPLGEWVLREAATEMKRLLDLGAQVETMAVNVSARQIRDATFERRLREILDETGLNPAKLELEITEGTLMEQGSTPLSVLQKLKAIGIRIAADDFGTGYSSLSYLQRLPLDKLKIDRSFVSDLDKGPAAQAISRAIIALAKTLNLEALAEGVETEAQLRFLADCGCDSAQGYYWGPPVPARSLVVMDGIKWSRSAQF